MSLLVGLLDGPFVLLEDLLALDLLRGSNHALLTVLAFSTVGDERGEDDTYVLWCPLIPIQHNPFNDFKRRQTTLSARFLQLGQNEITDLGVVDHVLQPTAGDFIVFGESHQGRLRRDNDGNRSALVRRGEDADVGDQGRRPVDGLELFQRNVLAVERLDQVLLAIDDADMPVLVELGNVARHEPPAFPDGELGLLLVVVVRRGHRVPADEELALGRVVGGEVARFGEVHQLLLDRGGDVAVGVKRQGEGIAERTHRARFGQTVAVDDGADGHGDEPLGVLGEGTAAGHGQAQSASGGGTDFAEDQIVQEPDARQVLPHEELFERERAPEEVPGEETTPVDLADNALADRLPDRRDADEYTRAEFHNVTLAVADRGLGQGPGRPIAHGRAPEQGRILEEELDDVRLREIGEEPIPGADVGSDDRGRTGNRRHDGLVLDGHAFGRARGAGGVHDTGEILGFRKDVLGRVLLAQLLDLIESEDLDMGELALEPVQLGLARFGLVVEDDVLYGGGFRQGVVERR